MDTNQAKIVELLREVHVLAFKEIERLNLRIAELESQDRKPFEMAAINCPMNNPRSTSKQPENDILNEKQVASYLNMSVATVRRWRLFRKVPKFVKIGRSVRYKCIDVEMWLNSGLAC